MRLLLAKSTPPVIFEKFRTIEFYARYSATFVIAVTSVGDRVAPACKGARAARRAAVGLLAGSAWPVFQETHRIL